MRDSAADLRGRRLLQMPVALIIELLYSLTEISGTISQDPFENRPSDTPMMAISGSIETNLHQQLARPSFPKRSFQ